MDIKTLDFKISNSEALTNMRYGFKELVKQCFDELKTQNENLQDLGKLQYYYFDEFEFGTNINDEYSFNTLYVEIKTIESFENDKLLIRYLQNIKSKIFEILISKCNKETLLWQSNNYINCRFYQFDQVGGEDKGEGYIINKDKNVEQGINKNSEKEVNDRFIYHFRILIGQTYKNEENEYGIKYYANKSITPTILYPKQVMEYYAYKNYLTKNSYTDYVNLIKKLLLPQKIDFKFTLIETILFNIPNNLFNKKPSLNAIRDIINFVRNNPIDSYLTLDKQNYAFISNNSELDIWDIKQFIKILEKFYKDNVN